MTTGRAKGAQTSRAEGAQTKHRYIDIGANLGHKSFRADLDAVQERAAQAGVRQIIVTGTSLRASAAALAIAEQSSRLFATAGVHPHEARTWRADSTDRQRALAEHESVVAIGECGLDYNRDFSPRADQRRAFGDQLALAAELQMPVFLHERDAHDDFLGVLREVRDRIPRAVVHCFTGSREILRAYLDLDLHIGLTGWICDERRGMHLREAVADIPSDRLMIETDSPFLLPRTIRPRPRSRRNEPAYLPHVASMIAGCLGKPVSQVAAETRRTAIEFFGLPACQPRHGSELDQADRSPDSNPS